MRRIFFAILMMPALHSFGQNALISYDDIRYLLQNNILHADTFLTAKGYVITKKDNDTRNRKYSLTLPGGTHNNISLRADGKRLFIEIETNEQSQYSLIRESIAQYLLKDSMVSDVQTYSVKDLGSIYITVNDVMPYDPLRREYDIHIVGDKHITAYN